MGDRSKHASMSPDLHRLLNYSSIPYRISSWNIQRNPACLAHKFSSQQPPNSSPAASLTFPNTHSNPSKQNHVSVPAGFVGCASLNYSSVPHHKITTQQSPNLSPASSATAPNPPSNPRKQNKVDVFAGLIHFASRIAAATAVAPIERVYILIQCQNEMIKYGSLSSPYKGMKDCFLRTIKHEGALSLWRGNSLNVMSSFLSSLILMVISPILPPFSNLSLNLMYKFKIHYPLEYARIRLANDVKAAQGLHFSRDSSFRSSSNDGVGNRKFSGLYDVFNKSLKSEGVIGLYRGYIPASLGIVSSYLYSQWIISATKQNKMTVRCSQEKRNWSESEKIIPLVMYFVGISAIHYPFVTVSRRMMITSGENIKYKGMVDAIHQIVKHEGVSSLYKGVTPYIIYLSSSSLAYLYSTKLVFKMLKLVL